MKTYQHFIEQVTATVNVDRRSVPAKATSQSVSGAVDRALSNPGQPQSASSETGKDKTTVSGSVSFSGRIGGGDKEKKEKKDNKERKERAKAERHKEKDRIRQRRLERRTSDPEPNPELARRQRLQQARRDILLRKNKFNTKYRYAVPSSVGGKYQNYAASGANQMTDWKAVKTNRTGGTNYQRTKVVGDPLGSGGTGRTISQARYNKLFGAGGKYEVPTDGSTKYPSTKLGRKFDPSGHQPNKFVR